MLVDIAQHLQLMYLQPEPQGCIFFGNSRYIYFGKRPTLHISVNFCLLVNETPELMQYDALNVLLSTHICDLCEGKLPDEGRTLEATYRNMNSLIQRTATGLGYQ